MKTIEARIKGTTALLMHRFAEQSEVNKPTRSQVVQERDPRQEAEKVAYRTSEGKFYIPGAAFSRLLREAGGAHKLKGTRKSAKYVVPSAVLVMDDAVILLNGDEKSPAKDFEVDSRPVVIPATKGRIMRHRPRFNCWSAKLSIRINDDILPTDFIHTLLTEGGQQIGVGDFRPEKGGPFGTFQVVEWK